MLKLRVDFLPVNQEIRVDSLIFELKKDAKGQSMSENLDVLITNIMDNM